MGPLAGAQAADPHGGRWFPCGALAAPALRAARGGRRARCRGGGGAAGAPAPAVPAFRGAALRRAAACSRRSPCDCFPCGRTGGCTVRLPRARAASTGVGFICTGAGIGAVRFCPHLRTVSAAL